MHTLSLREIQLKELDILLYFDSFCRKNDLRYSLCAGTLLGAIRHKGFIPWDDDIDVVMPRPDYERFITQWKDEGFFQLLPSQRNNIALPFAKIISTQISVKVSSQNGTLDNHLWIDIFPADGVPESDKEAKRIFQKSMFFQMLLCFSFFRLGLGRNCFRKCCFAIIKLLLKIYGQKRIVKQIEQLALKIPYEDSKYVGRITWPLGSGERQLRIAYEQFISVEFEGHEFPAMSCWQEYLEGVYGDYMTPPPVERRVGHLFVATMEDDAPNLAIS